MHGGDEGGLRQGVTCVAVWWVVRMTVAMTVVGGVAMVILGVIVIHLIIGIGMSTGDWLWEVRGVGGVCQGLEPSSLGHTRWCCLWMYGGKRVVRWGSELALWTGMDVCKGAATHLVMWLKLFVVRVRGKGRW